LSEGGAVNGSEFIGPTKFKGEPEAEDEDEDEAEDDDTSGGEAWNRLESRRATVSTIPVIFCLTDRSQLSRGDDEDDDDDDDDDDDNDDDTGTEEEDDMEEEDEEEMAAEERDADGSETRGTCLTAWATCLDLEARCGLFFTDAEELGNGSVVSARGLRQRFIFWKRGTGMNRVTSTNALSRVRPCCRTCPASAKDVLMTVIASHMATKRPLQKERSRATMDVAEWNMGWNCLLLFGVEY
jgi:hypothetical protein